MTSEKVLFVFYTVSKTFNEDDYWTYKKFPKGWNWIGAGTVNPIKGKTVSQKYEREEQFNGPLETRDKMISYLDEHFKKLKEKKIIEIYKIRKSYKP